MVRKKKRLMKPKKCTICNQWFTPRYKTTEKACSISLTYQFHAYKSTRKERQVKLAKGKEETHRRVKDPF